MPEVIPEKASTPHLFFFHLKLITNFLSRTEPQAETYYLNETEEAVLATG